MVEGLKRYYPRVFDLTIAAIALVTALWLPALASGPNTEEGNVLPANIRNSTLRVEGVGDGPTGETSRTLQGASSLPQSGDNGDQLQHSGSGGQLQQSGDREDLERINK